jgi:hypothetical protein
MSNGKLCRVSDFRILIALVTGAVRHRLLSLVTDVHYRDDYGCGLVSRPFVCATACVAPAGMLSISASNPA